MKKFVILFIALFCTLGASAQLNKKEKSFLNNLMLFVTKEGYRPEIDRDEDLSFKKEGMLYWIRVREEEEGYFYVTINQSPVDCEDADITAVRRAVNEVTKSYKVGKAYYSEVNNDVPISIEGFYKNVGDFTQYFGRYMNILQNMDEDIKENYDKFKD